MKLLTVGDSFTYGDELEDIILSWPFLLGQKIGYNVSNLAFPGSGNTKMIRNVMENYQKYDMIIIAWSHFARIEISDENGTFDIWPGSNLSIHEMFSYRKEIVKYITNYYSDVYNYQQFIINVLLLQNFLKYKNKRYVMINSFGNSSKEFQPQVKHLIDQIDIEYFLGWPDENMQTWTYNAKCSKGPRGHFLEQGHEVVANKIYEYIRHLGWVS